MDEWRRRVSAAIGCDEELAAADADSLLEIARIAARESGDRRNAPLLCYLVGRTRSDRSLEEILEAVRSSSS
jgi:hypothetical protein